MRNIKSTDRFKVWEINDRDGYAEVRMSESRKVKEDNSYDATQIQNGVAQNGYINTNWYFVRFTGHAYNKLKDIEVGSTITNLNMEISREPYFGDTNSDTNAAIDLLERNHVIVAGSIPKLPRVNGIVYPRNVRLTVFSFNTMDEVETNQNIAQPKNIDRAPKVEPMAQTVQQPQFTPVQPTTTIVQPTAPIQPVQNTQVITEASDNCPF